MIFLLLKLQLAIRDSILRLTPKCTLNPPFLRSVKSGTLAYSIAGKGLITNPKFHENI